MTERRETGPGCSEGPLSPEFPEVYVKVSSSFAHDAGMVSSVDELRVGDEALPSDAVLAALVRARGGWTQAGGSSDAEVLATLRAYLLAWDALFDDARHREPRQPELTIHVLPDGSKLVSGSWVETWDAGNHGRLSAVRVVVYRIADGTSFEMPSGDSLAAPAPPRADPPLPVPRQLGPR